MLEIEHNLLYLFYKLQCLKITIRLNVSEEDLDDEHLRRWLCVAKKMI
jgi:hypothetical protein